MSLRKHNIGTDDKLKLTSIRDYWDEQMTKENFDLLREYEGMFPSSVVALKWIKVDIGEMKIVMKPDTNPLKHMSYKLNPRVKEKVKKEIDKMLKAGLIFLVDEAEWVSPIVIQDKKDAMEISVCVDYHSLNNACVHDPFPTPFSDQVLDNVAWNEVHCFTDGFLGYH